MENELFEEKKIFKKKKSKTNVYTTGKTWTFALIVRGGVHATTNLTFKHI